MRKTGKNEEKEQVVTRAEKRDATKNLIKEVLKNSHLKASEVIDGAAKLYTERFGGEETENPNDVKGRVGSVLDVMKKDGEVTFDGGRYALKAESLPEVKEEKKKKTTRKKAEKDEKTEEKKTVKKAKKETAKEKKEPLAPPPIMPIAPVAPVTPESAPEPIPDEKPAPKKRGRKPKEKTPQTLENKGENALSTPDLSEKKEPLQEKISKPLENKGEEPISNEKTEKIVKAEEKIVESLENKGENTPSPEREEKSIMDVSFLLGNVKPLKKVEAPKTENSIVKQKTKTEVKKEEVKPKSAEKKPQEKAPVKKPTEGKASSAPKKAQPAPKKSTGRVLTADEKLQAAFLNKLHRLGGDYFEYYSVYLLEKYSRMNGRRLEMLKITGGERDGGIDGEIELTDKLGFRETIYIQAKNWDPDKGDEKLWVVGETLLQQFIGACVCRQAKDGKQHCRGIFITTSRFTNEAKKILEETSEKFVGYDGADLYEAAKECSFGIVKKNGEWALDEELLSGDKAFFNMK